jgi:RHS repeat-associated protein
MIREETYSGSQEYVYLGGHRLAMIVPSVGGGGVGGGCAGGGCSVASKDTWQTAAANGLLVFAPSFILLIFACPNGNRIKYLIIILSISCCIVVFSYLQSLAQPLDFTVYWYLNDHLDTPMRIVDVNRNVVNDTKLDAFGNVMYEEGSIQNNFRFPGQYHDRESGIYYNWNRYYVPSVGRYNRVDIDFICLGPNRNYTYTLNNPINKEDPEGLFTAAEYITCGKNLVDCARAYPCKDKAWNACNTKFGSCPDNSPENAFLHCYLNCCMAQKIGSSEAKKFGDAHEELPGNPKCYKDMDLHNNRIGQRLGGSNKRADFGNLCSNAKGELMNALPPDCKPCKTYAISP